MNDLTAALSGAGLARVAAELAAAARPCVRLRIPEARPREARSRIGGLPRLPNRHAWPSWRAAPLSHLCQIDLSEVTLPAGARSLPASGLLSFFYDPEQSTWGFDPADRGSWAVLYSERSDYPTTEPPPELAERAVFPGAALSFDPALCLPSTTGEHVERLGLSDPEYDALSGFVEAQKSPAHHLLGHPQPIQGEMELECQLASHGVSCGEPSREYRRAAKRLGAGAADWRLLLQLDSDEEHGMMWGDAGRLYFWMRASDLAARAFDNAWMILQCH